MDVSGVTESGAGAASHPSRGGRDGASEGSGPEGLVRDSPQREGRWEPTALERGAPRDGGDGGHGVPPLHPQGMGDGAGSGVPLPPPRLPGRWDNGGPPFPGGHGDDLVQREGPARLARTPPRGGGGRAPPGALDGAALPAALRDSLDAVFSPLHERLSLLETAIGTSRRSRHRRRRMSSSSSDGQYSGGERRTVCTPSTSSSRPRARDGGRPLSAGPP